VKNALVKYVGGPAKYMGESYAAGIEAPKHLMQAFNKKNTAEARRMFLANAAVLGQRAIPAVLATGAGLTGAGIVANKLMKKEAGAKEVKRAIVKGVKAGLSKAKGSFQAGFGKGPDSVRTAIRDQAAIRRAIKARGKVPAVEGQYLAQTNPSLYRAALEAKEVMPAVKKALPAYIMTAGGLGAAGYGGYKGVKAIQGSGKERKM